MKLALIISLFLVTESFLFTNDHQPQDGTTPHFTIHSESGKINLEDGLDKSIKSISIHAESLENKELRASLVQLTHIADGVGVVQWKFNEKVNLTQGYNPNSGDLLRIEVIEYKSKGADGLVETIQLMNPEIIEVPIK